MPIIKVKLSDIYVAQTAIGDLESQKWSPSAGGRVSLITKELVKHIDVIEEQRVKMLEDAGVEEYKDLSPKDKKILDRKFTKYLKGEEVEMLVPLLTPDVLGDVQLLGSTYRLLSNFFDLSQPEETNEQPAPEDLPK